MGTGTLPRAWADLQINALWVTNNSLTGILPQEWAFRRWRLSSNISISLSINTLKGTLPSVWQQLAIKELYLHMNNLTGGLPAEWGR